MDLHPHSSMACRSSAVNSTLPSPESTRKRAGPVPTRYVFVPCNVNFPGLQASTRVTRSLKTSIAGNGSIDAGREHFLSEAVSFEMSPPTTGRRWNHGSTFFAKLYARRTRS